MRIAISNTDLRLKHLGRLLKAAGHDIVASDDSPDMIVCRSEPSEYKHAGKARIVTFGPRNAPVGAVDLLLDEDYQSDIAYMTAEGAVARAMAEISGILRGAQCTVIGWGRIGRALTRLLTAIGAETTVISRRKDVHGEISAFGARAAGIDDADALKNKKVIFNTTPARMLEDSLYDLEDDVLIMDLAGAPYGFDVDRAAALGLKASRESGLPGRYCPETAGRAIFDALIRGGYVV